MEIQNVQAMKILDSFGVGGSFTEYYAMDYRDDVVLMGHGGPGHIAIAQGKTKVRPLTVYHGKVIADGSSKGLLSKEMMKTKPMTHALTLLLLVSVLPLHAAESKPALWAVYYAWYQTRGASSMWTVDGTDTPRSTAQPLIGYYDSDDPQVVRWHIRLAKAAGLDAFLVSWWGGANISGAAFEKTILPIAAEEKFQVALCSELAQFHHDVQVLAGQTSDVLRRTKDSAAYLRVDGKPLVYLYQVPFAPKLTPETFRQLCRSVEAEVGPVYWMMDKVTNAGGRGLNFPDEWLKIPEIPLVGFYGTFSVKRIWKYEDLAPHYARLVQQAHAAGKQAFLPVHPGHDNSGFRPHDFFVIPRDDGATLRGYLRAATDAGADAILLTSFNEWPETTIVEPASSWSDPYRYLRILAEWKGVAFTAPPLLAKSH